jgi:hypothetical protein
MAFQGVEGPIRPSGKVRVLPLDGLTRSRLQLEIDFEGVGIGKLLLPLVRSMAAKQIPKDQATLKAKLEAGA